jgi:hypothetical protein
MKNSIICCITPYSPLKIHRRLGGTCRFHSKGWTVCRGSFGCCLLHAGFLVVLLSNPENAGNMFLPNVRWLPTDYRAWFLWNSYTDSYHMNRPLFGSRDISIDTATTVWMTEELRLHSRQGSEIFSFSITSRSAVRPTHFLYDGYRGLFPRE